MVPLLSLLVFCSLATCAVSQFSGSGLLAEYFFPLPEDHCNPANGSTRAFDRALPNVTRREQGLFFDSAEDFGLRRCSWEVLSAGRLTYACRGQNELVKRFAARWTGFLQVTNAGNYQFELQVTGGGRVIIGNGGYGDCPGYTCGTREDVINVRLQQLGPTLMRNGTFARQCPLCEAGSYGTCWITYNGCEPFALWQLEGDGGLSGTCGIAPNRTFATRYLSSGIHPFRVEYFQRGGGEARMVLRYSGPDTRGLLTQIPAGNLLYPQSAGLLAEWYAVKEPLITLPPAEGLGTLPPGASLVRVDDDAMQNLGPGQGTFSTEVGRRNLMIRWRGFLIIGAPGVYTFRLHSKDGSRMILGRRGPGGELTVVDNDGLKDYVTSASGSVELKAGLHPIRIEYMSSPSLHDGSSSNSIRPAGIMLLYSGPDTGDIEADLTEDGARALLQNDIECSLTSWEWSRGLTMNRDCSGTCMDSREGSLGDGVCDDGRGHSTLSLTCPEYNNDNSDCLSIPNFDTSTTPRPGLRCLESCPGSNWQRHGCAGCKNRRGGYCFGVSFGGCNATAELRGLCDYRQCCTAKIQGAEYWGSDCLAYGTGTTCADGLKRILDDLQQAEPSLATQGTAIVSGASAAAPTGQVLSQCSTSYCNEITTAVVINPFTLLPTTERVCPVGESDAPGIDCFEGPWEVTGLTNPFTMCQAGKFQWNFCQNRKTDNGRPFAKCCAVSYINVRRVAECRFFGIESGTCEGFLLALQAKLGVLSISVPTVLNECTGDRCNDPSVKDTGCPDAVVKRPAITEGAVPAEVDVASSIAAAPQSRGENADTAALKWIIPAIVAGFIALFSAACAVYRVTFKEAPWTPWHSAQAKVIADDCWVEPAQDAFGKMGLVKPRPFAFNQLQAQQKVLPSALRLELEDAHPEVVRAALESRAAALESEASARGSEVSSPRSVSRDGRRNSAYAVSEDAEMLQDVISRPGEQRLALPALGPESEDGYPGSLALQVALPSQLPFQGDEDEFRSPPRTSSIPGSPEARTIATASRPPAAARYLRQNLGSGGVPRIAT